MAIFTCTFCGGPYKDGAYGNAHTHETGDCMTISNNMEVEQDNHTTRKNAVARIKDEPAGSPYGSGKTPQRKTRP